MWPDFEFCPNKLQVANPHTVRNARHQLFVIRGDFRKRGHSPLVYLLGSHDPSSRAV